MSNIQSYITNHKDRFLNELIELLKIPSISADSAYKDDVLKTTVGLIFAISIISGIFVLVDFSVRKLLNIIL